MALLPVSALSELIFQADLAAQGGVSSPEALANMQTRANGIAAAIDAFVRSSTVIVTATNAPGQLVVTDPVTGTGATTTPGSVTGTGVNT
jgi:hypothetical protein